ncbi:PREDICTED: probable low-specificity L-threonine aldolase 2 [Amphimedon queenslandica]|uniref:Aromatic amino acid beta-eliminating lyase/threonine aldolase domain-containing protein n=1 Tax=Amphimedon queenslandica TaxID=400682 RepID=A0A1X7VBZ3_AMPQE|nr:PREDICTED: probable low-specificity L-threonine aldolase 2 [Amphimedon queenslandica]|eukprot:XP_003385045.2 PREDICTED: probable low-specificity L-threonine aldolase 2 [Amphimedon queenslandica]
MSANTVLKRVAAAFDSSLFLRPLCKLYKTNMASTRVVDMRSDTVTTPTEPMRAAMAGAAVGDDVYGEDPTAIALQGKMASLLGKEAGLFLPTGTMSNLAALMCHANGRGEEVILGDRSHISIWEQGAIASLGGIFPRQVRNNPDGTLDLDELVSKIHPGGHDGHYCLTKAIVIENTQNFCGGAPISPEYMDKVASIARKHSLKIHVDGARLFNAATALDVEAKELVKHADTVSVCLSKGLGAPVGSVLVGSKETIDRCHRIRKALGGGMRQIGVLAAPGLVALETILPLLKTDHENAKLFAQGVAGFGEFGVTVDVERVRSNMVLFSIERDDLRAERFCEFMEEEGSSDSPPFLKARLLAQGTDGKVVRAVFHHQVSREDTEDVLKKMRNILSKKY